MPPIDRLNRREWLQVVGAGAAATAAIGCGTEPNADGALAMLVLEPAATALMVAVHSSTAHSVNVEIRDGGVLVRSQTLALGASGSAVIELDGLASAHDYELEATPDDGASAGTFHVRTAPADDDPQAVRLAVSADIDPYLGYDNGVLDQLADADMDVHVTIGDFPYTDNGPPAMTVPAYRERHREVRVAPRMKIWMQAAAIRAIYDDHEFRNNWDAAFAAAEGARYAAAMQVWDEFFPVRGAVGEIRYRSWRWGANVECFQLDCRRFRSSDAAPDGANKTMLGATQYAWLLAGLTASTAPFKLIFTSVPLAFGTGDDHWAAFSYERDALFFAIAKQRISGVLFVSGDQHFFATHRHAYGIREFQIGPLARGLGTPGPMVPGVLFRHVDYNTGIVDITPDSLTFAGLGPDGVRFYEETFTVAQLTPDPPPPVHET
jgi:phosphodiesterase/alkaline phosphatase D-like protein